MPEITDHLIETPSDADVSRIEKYNGPGPGGAYHDYIVSAPSVGAEVARIHFQEGPVHESGVNGVTQEALIAIAMDRLRDFQQGPGRCRENSLALTKLEEAMHWLHSRTRDRLNRGVEGTSAE